MSNIKEPIPSPVTPRTRAGSLEIPLQQMGTALQSLVRYSDSDRYFLTIFPRYLNRLSQRSSLKPRLLSGFDARPRRHSYSQPGHQTKPDP